MNILTFVLNGHNLNKSLKCFQLINKNSVTKKYFLREFKSMTKQNKQAGNKDYIAVNVTENNGGNLSKQGSKLSLSIKSKNVQPPGKEQNLRKLKASEVVRLLSLAKNEKCYILVALCFLVCSASVTMAIPMSLGKVLDIIYEVNSQEETRSRLNMVCGALIGVFVFGAVCNFGRTYLFSTIGYRVTQQLRKNLFSSMIKQETAFFDKRATGELVNRLSADTQLVGQALSVNIGEAVRSTILICAGTGMMIYVSPKLALISLSVVPPIVLIAVCYGRFIQRITRRVQDSLADATKLADEKLANIRTVRVFSCENREMDNYAKQIDHVLQLGYYESKARASFYAAVGFCGYGMIVMVLYFGGIMVSSNAITIGSLTSFVLYSAYIASGLGELSVTYSEINKAVGGAHRIWEIIDRVPKIPITGGLTPAQPPEGAIEFRNVSFSYPQREEAHIFENLNLKVNPKQNIALVGPSGSGKSTVGLLLLRLYEISSGTILLDGYDIKTLNPEYLRKHIGTVSQEPVLFSCSIRDNITYGVDDPSSVTEDQLMHVVKEANVLEFIKNLPDGLETLVGERGVMLSGGQKQRVAIARALLKNPQILILDEATSALDSTSEKLVQEALDKIMKNRTVLTIAHRLSTIQDADTIIVLKDGIIAEEGKYADLIHRKKGIFKQLVKHQAFHQSPLTREAGDVEEAHVNK